MNRNNIYFLTPKRLISCLLALVLLFPVIAISQNNTNSGSAPSTDTTGVELLFPFNDFTGNPFIDNQNSSPLFMSPPSNIEREIVYNPETNTYEFVNKIGEFQYRTPTEMDFDEFQNYELQRDVANYWNERTQTAGTAEGERL
ncbi:MAG: hypothetical protein QM503_13290, partial [Bacteroidota bacterium]